MNDIFHSVELNKNIRQNGFVNIDLINPSRISDFVHLVNTLDNDISHDDVHIETPFRLSAFNNNSAYKEKIHNEVFNFLKSEIDSFFVDYEPLVINIFEKLPGNGAVQIHQNPSFVKEPEYKSISVWIPLINASRHNGGLGVLKGSQDVFDSIRASNMPYIFEDIAEDLQNKYFEALEVKLGQAIVLDDSVVHWSYPNRSKEVRKAVQLIMVPKSAEHTYYYYDESGEVPQVKLYEVDKHFFYNFNCYDAPVGLKSRGAIDFTYKKISEEEMVEKVSKNNPEIKKKYHPVRNKLKRLVKKIIS